VLSDDFGEAEAELIWRLLDLQVGMRVLVFARCGATFEDIRPLRAS
jgi:hypothetical protein